MAQQKKINVLITLPAESAKILRTIANNKAFASRKDFIQSLCNREVVNFLNKQTKLKL